MKHLFKLTLLLLELLLPATAAASPITLQQAQQNAMSFLDSKGKSISSSSLRQARLRSTSTTAESYYIFNIGSNEGYVIAAGDDCAPAILGYADAGYIDVDSMPVNLQSWLEEYAQQIQFMQENGFASLKAPKLTSSYAPISPLLTTSWDQQDPYNQNCPDFFSYGKCVTGCVATAMAQVMYYHRTNSVAQTTAQIPAYDCRTLWLNGSDTLGHIHVDAIPAGSPIDWSNMLDSYSGSATTTQKQAVANLMKYCGAAVQMNYANAWSGGSGAYSTEVPTALKAFFNYSSETMLKNRSDYSSNDAWESLIYNELSSSRPVYYSGSNSSGGHAFVCDGYDGSGYYHINWGWSGTSDGYFLLTALDPNQQGTGGSSSGYNQNQAALINAQPRSSTPPPSGTGIIFADVRVKVLCVQNWDTNGDGELSVDEAAAVTSLGDAFKNSSISSFDELQYFTGLTMIGSYTFNNCSGLTSIIIPSSVTTIGQEAFNNCSGLTSIVIPSSVTSIDSWSLGNSFKGCTSLSSIKVDPNNTVYDSRGNCNAIIKKSNNALIVGCKNTVIPSSVTTIGEGSFYSCSSLTSIIIPNSVTSIGEYAFSWCSGLTSITIPSSVTGIGHSAFSHCSGLTSITVNSSNTVYDSRGNCNAVIKKSNNELIVGCKNTIIPSSVTSIGSCAFNGCSGLTSISIPSSVTSIGDWVFASCTGLTSITIPESVTSIDDYAFYKCSNLTGLTSLASIPPTIGGSHTFSSITNKATLYVPAGKKNIYENADYWQDFSSIVELDPDPILATTVSLNKTSAEINTGGTLQLTATVLPSNATNKTVTWTASNSSVATVTNNGLVTSIAPGTTTITATTTDGSNLSASCSVTVKQSSVLATSISLNKTSATETEGNTLQLTATVLPSNATNKTVTWTTSNSSVATVNSNGLVTAKAAGNATITARTTDGTNLSASCVVTVISNQVNYDNYLSMDDIEVFHGDTIVVPVKMTNETSIISFQTDIFLPEGIELLQEDGEYLIDPSERMTRTHSIMSNDVSSGAVRVICYSSNYKPFTGNSGDDLFYITVKVADNAEGIYTIQLKNTLLTTSDFVELTAPDAVASVNVKSYLLGDANNSGTVTVTDVVVTSQYVLELNPQPFVFEAADVNTDGNITVTDVSRIAWMVLNPTLNAPLRAPALWNIVDRMTGEDITLTTGETRRVSILLDNEMDYSAFQLDLNLPDGLTASNFQLTDRASSHAFDVNTLQNGKIRALCYSPAITGINGHEGALLTFDVTATGAVTGDILVDGIELVTTTCQTVKLDSFTMAVNNTTSMKELSTGKTIARIEYFNLAGQQIARPESGVTLVVTTYTDGTRSTAKLILK